MTYKVNILYTILFFLACMVTNHLIGMQYDLISGCRDSSIALWRNKREKFEQVETLEKHGPRVCIYVLCFSPCGQCFASGSDDGAIKIWEIIPSKWNRDGELRCIQTISRNENGHNHEISALTFSTCGNFLASADWNGVIKVWQKRVQGESKKKQKWRCIQMLNELADRRNEAIFSLCFSRCGNYLFSGSRDTTIKAWTKKDDMFTCTQVLDRHNNGHSLPVCALSFSPRYNYLVSGGKKVGAIKLWRMSESAEKHNRQMVHLQTTNRAQNGHCGDVRSFCFSPCGRYLASGSTDNTVKLWLLRNDKLIFLQQLGQEVDQQGMLASIKLWKKTQ